MDGIADEGDPNYDPNADDHDNNYVLVRSVVVFTFCSSSDGAACVELVDIPSSTILVHFENSWLFFFSACVTGFG